MAWTQQQARSSHNQHKLTNDKIVGESVTSTHTTLAHNDTVVGVVVAVVVVAVVVVTVVSQWCGRLQAMHDRTRGLVHTAVHSGRVGVRMAEVVTRVSSKVQASKAVGGLHDIQ
jgi:hypothetical protein